MTAGTIEFSGASKAPVIVGLGEALWDMFPEGPQFGGAPANFARTTARLAGDQATVHMISAVGDDELGHSAIQSLAEHGVATSCVQINERATGKVHITTDKQGDASYRFDEDSAWDAIVWTDAIEAIARRCSAVCFGTLAQRQNPSRKTIQKFVWETPSDCLRVYDINLRKPHIEAAVIERSLELANALKLNEDELPFVAKLAGQPTDQAPERLLADIAARYSLRFAALTMGPEGAFVYSADDGMDHQPAPQTEVVNTVGAGDAYTAALILNLVSGEDITTANSRAVATAAIVCQQPGATLPPKN